MSAVTIVIVIIVVIILFTYFYHMYKNWKKNKKKFQWPPEKLPCPDYWVHEGNGACKNPFGLGLGYSNTTIPETDWDFRKKSPACAKPNAPGCLKYKRDFANKTQNPWFGIAQKCHKNPGNCYVPA
jgi:hypothetical protein